MNKKIICMAAAACMVCMQLSALEFEFSWSQEVSVPGSDEKQNFSVTLKDLQEAYKSKKDADIDLSKIEGTENESAPKNEDKPDIDTIRTLAESGNPSFQIQLGIMYAQGKWLERDWNESLRWFELAAEQGNARAQNYIGSLYVLDKTGIPNDYEKAKVFFEKSAAQNYSKAYLGLGYVYYRTGKDNPQNYKKSLEYYKKAEKLGLRDAYYCIGSIYMEGAGVPQNDKKAFSYFEKGAKKGNVFCQRQLGLMYRDGKYVKKDTEQSKLWLNYAAKQGDEKAAQALSELEAQ